MKHPDADTKKKIVRAFKTGETISHIAKVFGFHRNSISLWIEQSKLDPGFLGGRVQGGGRPSLLEGETGKQLLKLISKPASLYGFESDFWTTSRLQQICDEEIGIRVSRMAIHRTLVKFGQSFKKPQKRYIEASKRKQTAWVRDVLPKIKKIAKSRKAILYFEDESSIDLTPVIAKTWGPIGKKTFQKVTGNRSSVSAISAISSQGHLLFNIHKAGKRYNADDIIDFLESMLKHHPRRCLIVVMDQAPCHRAKKVQEFLLQQKRLHVYYLPPRSPEFNPDEKVWSHLKNHDLKSHKAKSTVELRKLATRKMRSLARDSSKVRGIFRRCEMAHIYLT